MSHRTPVIDPKAILRKLYTVGEGAIKAVNNEARTVSHVITAKVTDRDGDVVVPRGGRFDDYLKNPVVFFNHRSFMDPPVGKCLSLDVSDNEVVATTKFAGLDQAHPMAETIFRLLRDGYMRGWSMGFMVDTVGTQKVLEDQAGRSILEWTLLEYSAVGIPANPDALTRMLKRLGLPEGATEKDLYEAVTGPDNVFWSLALPIDGEPNMEPKSPTVVPPIAPPAPPVVAQINVDVDKLAEKLLPQMKEWAASTIVVKSEEIASKMTKAAETLVAASSALALAVAAVAEAAESLKGTKPADQHNGDKGIETPEKKTETPPVVAPLADKPFDADAFLKTLQDNLTTVAKA